MPLANENDLGALLALLVSTDGSKMTDATLSVMIRELSRVGLELQRRRAVMSVVDEEKAFMLRVDAVTFWLRDLDYGLMAEGTALRVCNEWLKVRLGVCGYILLWYLFSITISTAES